ncbi:unnamed protein product [Staurois parvus]|uniref:Secreted protein n=1 Tax=Staurois parvus TaxID=386267 RepID=A0ABN9GAQ1_9NEOB|nr:unnamed protein product [Staurois parvus]
MGPVPTPHAAARTSVSWVPVRPPIAAVSIATLCHVPLSRSPHTAGGFHFCHRVLYGLPLLAIPSTATSVVSHSGLAPWTAQMSEVVR